MPYLCLYPSFRRNLKPSRSSTLTIGVVVTSVKILTFLALLIACTPYHLYAQTVPDSHQEVKFDEKLKLAAENLKSIQQSIELKRSAVREHREQLKKLEEVSDRQEVEQKIERIKNEISDLQVSYEEIALGGVNLSVFTDKPEKRIDWQDEIEQISRPILSALKDLTSKPRQLDSLRRQIDRQEDQLKETNKAISSIQLFVAQTLTPEEAAPLNQMQVEWAQRRNDIQRALELTRFKLADLSTKDETWQTSTGEAIVNFITGRGLTLFLAIIISLILWLGSRALLNIYWRWIYKTKHNIGLTHAPLIIYSYRIFTAVAIVFAILMVFYVRGDVLLLTLAILALVGVALSLRQTLPRYAAELRLLLGIGPVREGERLVLDGIPLMVESLSIYTVLRNPELEGVVRLPLHSMNALASRPAGQEPWFPCKPGEYILTENGKLGTVKRQTVELVEIAILNSTVQIKTQDFLSLNVRNLSRDGFGIASTFGVDYQHQAISLDKIPERLREGIIARFENEGLKDDIESILVEFKEAGASSLDYQVYIVLNGRAASAFFRSQRMIQQACVETCNMQGWVIPFTQVTVHSGDTGDKVNPVESY